MKKDYTISLNGQEYPYIVEYKKIKNIYLKVEQGVIYVKAPMHTSQRIIERFIHQYQNKLVDKVEQYQPYFDYQTNGYVYIFNEKYNIKLYDMDVLKCETHDYYIYVYHQDIKRCIEKYLRQVLLKYIEERTRFYIQMFPFDFIPQIQVRKYKGRWGSCFYKEERVSFSLSLVHLEKELIDYVILHELTHFIEANHSKRFYIEIEKRMPDYRNRIRLLKEKHV